MPIKNIKKITVAAVLASQLGWVLAAGAVGLTFSADTNVVITSPSATLTIKSGSVATSVVVNTNNIVVTMPANSTFTVTSATNELSTVSNPSGFTVTNSCSSSRVETMTVTSGAAPDAITISPLTTLCTSVVGGGGVSSGGGSSSNAAVSAPATAAPTSVATPAVPALSASVASPTENVYGGTVVSLQTRLVPGTKGDEVKALQEFLAKDKDIYPQGIVSGFFGPLTMKAVQKFQEKYGIAKNGDAGYGNVGPKTRAKIKELSGGQGGQASAAVTVNSSADAAAQLQAMQVQLNAMLQQLKAQTGQ